MKIKNIQLPRLSRSMLLSCVLLVAVLSGCKGEKGSISTPKPVGLQQEDVIGKWRAKSMQVDIASFSNTKRDSSFAFDAGKVSENSNRRAVLTIITSDGEYREETRTATDSLILETTGYWHLKQDTLIFRLRSVNAAEKRYHASRKGNRLLLKSSLDFDGDLKKDDAMTVILEKEQ